MKVAYGITIEDNDSYVENAKLALAGLAEAGHPGSFLVDMFPIMKYIPGWFPGAEWKRKAARWRHINGIVANYPWNLVKEQMAGVFLPSFSVDGTDIATERGKSRTLYCYGPNRRLTR